MSKKIKIRNQIIVGKNNKLNNKLNYDVSKVFNINKCVVHLIDTSIYKHSNDCNNDNNGDDDDDDDDNNNDDNINIKLKEDEINNFITEHCIELWAMMKKGDFIEDIAISCNNMNNKYYNKYHARYIVDVELNQSIHIELIRQGLVIKNLFDELYESKYKYYLTPKININMYTITEFPIGYFDNIVFNDFFCSNNMINYSNYSNEQNNYFFPILFDTIKLKFDKLTNTDIMNITYNKEEYDHYEKKIMKYNEYYIYIIIIYENIKYMIVSRDTDKYHEYYKIKTMSLFLTHIKSTKMIECLVNSSDDNIKNIAQKENILINNVILLA